MRYDSRCASSVNSIFVLAIERLVASTPVLPWGPDRQAFHGRVPSDYSKCRSAASVWAFRTITFVQDHRFVNLLEGSGASRGWGLRLARVPHGRMGETGSCRGFLLALRG